MRLERARGDLSLLNQTAAIFMYCILCIRLDPFIAFNNSYYTVYFIISLSLFARTDPCSVEDGVESVQLYFLCSFPLFLSTPFLCISSFFSSPPPFLFPSPPVILPP